MLNSLKRRVPLSLRVALRTRYERLRRSLRRALRPADPLMPPDELMFVGGDSSNFKQMGEKWAQTLILRGGLGPRDRVLEAGCGVGRMAVALTGYITPPGSYDGFDIVAEGVEWCRRNVTPRFPHFRFVHADVYNKQYNPGGSFAASEYRFPYPDGSFDFVFLTSVFTHMLPADVRNYLREVGRVLRPGGRCLITYFIITEDSLRRVEAGQTAPERDFRHDMGGYRTIHEATPEAGVAYAEEDIRRLYAEAGLSIVEPPLYGGWSGRPDALHGQDIVVARKP